MTTPRRPARPAEQAQREARKQARVDARRSWLECLIADVEQLLDYRTKPADICARVIWANGVQGVSPHTMARQMREVGRPDLAATFKAEYDRQRNAQTTERRAAEAARRLQERQASRVALVRKRGVEPPPLSAGAAQRRRTAA